MLRTLHTADWHLGQRLHEQSREYEHRLFLDWLLEQLQQQAVDALIVAGDIFDSANPPIHAQRLFYEFVSTARSRLPDLQMIFVAGNHDSPTRLESASPLFDMIGVHAIGAVSTADGELESERLLIPLKNSRQETEGLCAAMPYLRPVDLPPMDGHLEDELAAGIGRRYAKLLDAARQQRRSGQALLLTGHCYMVNGRISELSERRIQSGNQQALPLDIFGDEPDYVALGHLHLAQELVPGVRYSGSPIPLSLAEQHYRHQVVLADFENGRLTRVHTLDVPRTVEIIRLPAEGPAPWEEVSELLENLELDDDLPPEEHPFLEVRVKLDAPRSGLWEEISAMLKDRPVRFLKLSTERSGSGEALADQEQIPDSLDDLQPEEVFRLRYRSEHDSEVPDELLIAFRQLQQQIEETGA